jgi:hypothetical protein
MKNNSLVVEKTHSIGMHVLRLLLLTLQLEVELFLALHYRKKSQRIRRLTGLIEAVKQEDQVLTSLQVKAIPVVEGSVKRQLRQSLKNLRTSRRKHLKCQGPVRKRGQARASF